MCRGACRGGRRNEFFLGGGGVALMQGAGAYGWAHSERLEARGKRRPGRAGLIRALAGASWARFYNPGWRSIILAGEIFGVPVVRKEGRVFNVVTDNRAERCVSVVRVSAPAITRWLTGLTRSRPHTSSPPCSWCSSVSTVNGHNQGVGLWDTDRGSRGRRQGA